METEPAMVDLIRTLSGDRHDEPSLPSPALILSCNLDYRTGGSLLEIGPGAVFKRAEDSRLDLRKPQHAIQAVNSLNRHGSPSPEDWTHTGSNRAARQTHGS